MKSLLISTTFPPRTGGRERYLHSIFSQFPSEDLVVVTWDREGDWAAYDRQSPFRIIRVDKSSFFWYFDGRRGRLKWLAFLGALCLRERIDVVHCGLTIPDAMTGWLLKRALDRPYVVFTYAKEILGPWPTEEHRRRAQETLNGSDRVVTISAYTRDKLIGLGIEASRIEMVHPGVDLKAFHPDPASGRRIRARLGLSADQPVLLTVARLMPRKGDVARKGHDTVIDALPAILTVCPDTAYVIVGEGCDRLRLEALVRDRQLDERVVFAGQVPDADLPGYYNAADVFVMPNREEGTNVEGFGIVFLEANACGKPVIGGRSGGTADAIADGESGYLVDPKDSAAVARATIGLLTDTSLALRMGSAGRRRAEASFSWERASRQVQSITRSVADASGRNGVPLVHPARLARTCRFLVARTLT